MTQINQALIEFSRGNSAPLNEIVGKLTKERDDIVAAAQQRIAYVNGQIELLKGIAEGTAEGTAEQENVKKRPARNGTERAAQTIEPIETV